MTSLLSETIRWWCPVCRKGTAQSRGRWKASWNLAQKFAVLGACSAGSITSPLEAQRLVDALLQSENPEFTSAGKRIIAIIAAEELEKRF